VLLVTEAGGIVTHFDGGKFTLDSREVLATNGLILGEMTHIFTELFAGKNLEPVPTPAVFAARRAEIAR
jgi:myo-inositol-1(or 4)-monophosphatase